MLSTITIEPFFGVIYHPIAKILPTINMQMSGFTQSKQYRAIQLKRSCLSEGKPIIKLATSSQSLYQIIYLFQRQRGYTKNKDHFQANANFEVLDYSDVIPG